MTTPQQLLPADYLERVYAGVLGKLIGVYAGRPIEGWTADRIQQEIGVVDRYINNRFGSPLVVTDDDLSGTFTFIRALEDHGISPHLTSQQIGETWLNYIIEHRTILWWGGLGVSTEHTAWDNLRNGIPAPHSGSVTQNGQTVAEQIGAQIFIDGWALVTPGRPQLAARLAGEAARVSHDGEAVYAAMLWCAMESAAFLSSDVDHLLTAGLSFVPEDCQIAQMIADVRGWHRQFPNWQDTRQRIEDRYGYQHFGGDCHVIPNHALMIMSLLHAANDFHLGQTIISSAGWDTDCNAGNLGCLHGIMLGLAGLDGPYDWRTPVADRLQISSADGGNSITDAVRTSYYLCNVGRALANHDPLPPPKNGARFHFTLPGSVQGFTLPDLTADTIAQLSNQPFEDSRALCIDYSLAPGASPIYIATPTFSPPTSTYPSSYQLQACPLLHPGQTVRARVIAAPDNPSPVEVSLGLEHYDVDDKLTAQTAPVVVLAPGDDRVLQWQVPEFGGYPIASVGVVLHPLESEVTGRLTLDHLTWDGTPDCILRRPAGAGEFWHRSWVNGAQIFESDDATNLVVRQEVGDGLILHGSRDWTDYTVATRLHLDKAECAGVLVRAQGLRRYYGVLLRPSGEIQLIRRIHSKVVVLATQSVPGKPTDAVPFTVTVRGTEILATVGTSEVRVSDDDPSALTCGGMGLLVNGGTLTADSVRISPASTATD